MNLRPWLVLVLAAFLAVPRFVSAAPPTPSLEVNQTIKLPCGHTIKILSISKIESSPGVTALMVRYETTLSIDQHKELSEEVDDVWKCTVKEAEKGHYSEAILSSNEVPKGVFLTASRMYNFVFEKEEDGTWTRLGRADFMAAQ